MPAATPIHLLRARLAAAEAAVRAANQVLTAAKARVASLVTPNLPSRVRLDELEAAIAEATRRQAVAEAGVAKAHARLVGYAQQRVEIAHLLNDLDPIPRPL